MGKKTRKRINEKKANEGYQKERIKGKKGGMNGFLEEEIDYYKGNKEEKEKKMVMQ